MNTTDLATVEQALAFQTRLVRRGVLTRIQHDIADDTYETVRNTVCIHCTCGTWLTVPTDADERLYTAHIAGDLASKIRFGRAA